MKEYNMIGRDIGIAVIANNAHEAMKKVEETLLQGLGGSVEFLDEKDKIEYENAKQMRNFEERQVREMGYRSEVAIKCEEKAYEMLKETCHDADIMPDKIFKDGDEYILYWDWIKWYEDYEDVSAIVKTLDKLDELQDPNDYETTGYGYRFMRLGEDDEDTETRENDWDIELWMIRRIDIPDGLKEIKE